MFPWIWLPCKFMDAAIYLLFFITIIIMVISAMGIASMGLDSRTQLWGYIRIENGILKNPVQFSRSWELANASSCQFFNLSKKSHQWRGRIQQKNNETLSWCFFSVNTWVRKNIYDNIFQGAFRFSIKNCFDLFPSELKNVYFSKKNVFSRKIFKRHRLKMVYVFQKLVSD